MSAFVPVMAAGFADIVFISVLFINGVLFFGALFGSGTAVKYFTAKPTWVCKIRPEAVACCLIETSAALAVTVTANAVFGIKWIFCIAADGS